MEINCVYVEHWHHVATFLGWEQVINVLRPKGPMVVLVESWKAECVKPGVVFGEECSLRNSNC